MKCFITSFVFVISATTCGTVLAATCPIGQYKDNDGVCRQCKYNQSVHAPIYCPGDDTRHDCPISNADYDALAAQQGGHTIIQMAGIWSRMDARSASYCYSDIFVATPEGHTYLAECAWNGDNYYYPCQYETGDLIPYLWQRAGTGYYLAGKNVTNGVDFYNGVAACTNKPANSYYTGAGTPEGNDCPWECNSGYGRHNNECFQLCAAGFVSLKSNGVSVNAYAEKLTTPAINISANGKTCYVSLSSSGSPSGAIYINYNGTTYHTID